MKYIEANKIKTEINHKINFLKRSRNPNPFGTIYECMVAAEIEALRLVIKLIDNLSQNQPTP